MRWLSCTLLLAAGLPAGLAAQTDRSARTQDKPPAKPEQSDPARAFAERIARYAGSEKAFREIHNLAFQETTTTARRGAVATRHGLWLLAPTENRARFEAEGENTLGREIMVLDTPSRKNLLTVPERPGPGVSLWSEWHRVRRHVFLPFVILDPDVGLALIPNEKGDPATVQRLRVTWPKTRNYAYVDDHELVAEIDTGRLVRAIAISGTRGQYRVTYKVSRWIRVGPMRLPTAFELEDGRVSSSSMFFTDMRLDVVVPKDAWSRPKKLIAGLAAKPAPKKQGKSK